MPNNIKKDTLNTLDSIINHREENEHILNSVRNDYHLLSDMSALTRTVVGPYTEAILINSATGTYAVAPEDFIIGYELRSAGVYGASEIASIIEFITPDSEVLIVGAHIGTIAIPVSRLCRAVVAIEANPSTFKLLKTNIRLNEIDNCEAHNIAASEKQEKIHFMMNSVNPGGSKRKPLVDHLMYNYDQPQEKLIDAFPLDLYLQNRQFNIILMDIEGSEYFALKGMPDMIKNTDVLIMEFIPHHLKNISGVHVDDLLALLTSFHYLYIPSSGIKVTSENFSLLLNHMYDHNIAEDGLIFTKNV